MERKNEYRGDVVICDLVWVRGGVGNGLGD
jgi:hypothetical protein